MLSCSYIDDFLRCLIMRCGIERKKGFIVFLGISDIRDIGGLSRSRYRTETSKDLNVGDGAGRVHRYYRYRFVEEKEIGI